eukprot:CAMPEP_0195070640 /NCGR_PEP_ID=MMETSP0448-20130528/14645_1 /TAXON_ID=66468 /ORGANISM="Heterocapsa triquestra, Strain CCMP 448" /LENGTH=150 /DNA_ID=CAMNT_0040102371 /DNA_START=82 /DNA_END=531 /DNA_ORIENTATION=-
MSSYSLVGALLAERAEGSLPEREEAVEHAVNEALGGARDIVLQASCSHRLECHKAAISRLPGFIKVTLLATVVVAVGVFRQGLPTAPKRSQASAAKNVQLLQSNEDPCEPLMDKSGELLAMNPCTAPMDTLGQPASMGEIKKELGQDVAE